MFKIPWDLGYQCKQEEIPSVLFAIMCMHKAFSNEKCIDRKTYTADVIDQFYKID